MRTIVRKTNNPVKSIDHDAIQGSRRVKPTKRFEFWHRCNMLIGDGQWSKSRTYESQEEAVLMGEKRLREFDSKWMSFKIVDKITQEIIWQSPDIKENQQQEENNNGREQAEGEAMEHDH